MSGLINIPIEIEYQDSPECRLPESPLCQQYAVTENQEMHSWGNTVTVRCESYHNEEFEAKCPFCAALVKFHRNHLKQHDVSGIAGACPHMRKVISIPRPCVLKWGVMLVEFSRRRAVANALKSPTVEDMREALKNFAEADITEFENDATQLMSDTTNEQWPLRGYALDVAAEWRKTHNYPKGGK